MRVIMKSFVRKNCSVLKNTMLLGGSEKSFFIFPLPISVYVVCFFCLSVSDCWNGGNLKKCDRAYSYGESKTGRCFRLSLPHYPNLLRAGRPSTQTAPPRRWHEPLRQPIFLVSHSFRSALLPYGQQLEGQADLLRWQCDHLRRHWQPAQ